MRCRFYFCGSFNTFCAQHGLKFKSDLILKKLLYFLKNNKFSKQLTAWSKNIILPGFEGMTLYVTLHFLFESFINFYISGSIFFGVFAFRKFGSFLICRYLSLSSSTLFDRRFWVEPNFNFEPRLLISFLETLP